MIHEKLMGIVLNNPELWPDFYVYGNLFRDPHINRLFNICEIINEKYGKINKNLIVDYINENRNYDLDKFYEIYDSECYDENYKTYLRKYIEDDLKLKLKIYINSDLKDKGMVDLKYDVKDILDSVNDVDQVRTENTKKHCIKLLDDINENRQIKKIPSGIDFIDCNQLGYKTTDYVLIGATESTGKTSLVINSIVKQLKEKIRIGFISCEMEAEEIHRLIACNVSGLDNTRVENNLLTQLEKERYVNALERIYDKPLFVEDKLYEWHDIRQKLKTLKREENIDIGYLDYLHYVRHKNHSDTYERLGEISKATKSLCKELQIPIVAIVILNKIGAGDSNPDIIHIKGNNDIGYDADIAILLKTFNEAVDGNANERIVDFLFRKNRGGKRGFERMRYLPYCRRFQKLEKY
jgi:replicative DNA helicase